MLSTLIGYVWNSGVLVGAFCTIVFLVIIRTYTRDTSSKKSKIGKVAEKIGEKIGDVNKDIDKVVEGLSDPSDADDATSSKCAATDKLDVQFYGELFLASVMSSSVVKLWWH